MMKDANTCPIGGYFSLELPVFPEYHTGGIALNSGRHCLEYILRYRKYNKIYVPYFSCDTILEPLRKLNRQYCFYNIDKNYRLVDDIILKENEAVLYINYWGLQNCYCEKLASKYGKQLILDFTQAFFTTPISGIDTFYSCRKFFGVPDGGYLYTDGVIDFKMEQDESWQRMDSLVKRIDLSSEAGYEDFHKTSSLFHDAPMRQMSKFTKRMMQSIDYGLAAQRRIDNYNILRRQLGGRQLSNGEIPMIFPYTVDSGNKLREHLIINKIFVAKYWPNVEKWIGSDSTEVWIANNVLPLPIDQRYDEQDMNRIVETVNTYGIRKYADINKI